MHRQVLLCTRCRALSCIMFMAISKVVSRFAHPLLRLMSVEISLASLRAHAMNSFWGADLRLCSMVDKSGLGSIACGMH